MRHGRLPETNHSFLHGRLAAVPGSWELGDVKCGQVGCRALGSKTDSAGRVDKDVIAHLGLYLDIVILQCLQRHWLFRLLECLAVSPNHVV